MALDIAYLRGPRHVAQRILSSTELLHVPGNTRNIQCVGKGGVRAQAHLWDDRVILLLLHFVVLIYNVPMLGCGPSRCPTQQFPGQSTSRHRKRPYSRQQLPLVRAVCFEAETRRQAPRGGQLRPKDPGEAPTQPWAAACR